MRYITYYILTLFLALNLASCTSSEEIIPPPGGGETGDYGKVTLYFRNSGSPQTRALNDSLESVIESIDILAFEASGSSVNFAYRKMVNQADIKTDPNDYSKKHFTVEVPKDKKYYKYVLLANARTETDACFYNNDHKGEAKEDLVAKIVSTESAAWNVDPVNFKRIPMWGESDGIKTIESLDNEEIYLYRSVGVVDIDVDATVPFDLREIYVYNRPTRGRIAPNTDYFNSAQKRFTTPSLPSLMSIVDQITANASASPLATPGSGTNKVKDEIFLYETDKYGSANFLYATCLVLGGYVSGQSAMSYYRVDFADYRQPQGGTTPSQPDWDQGPPGSSTGEGGMVGSGDKSHPILRNHRYDLKISGVSGLGSTTPLDAAQTQHSQMIYEFTTWNIQSNDIYLDNNPYELKIDKSVVNLYPTNIAQVSLHTTYPGTWAVGNFTDDWFDCKVSGPNTNGTIEVKLSGSNPSPMGSTGYFKVKLMDGKREVLSQLIKVEYK